MDYTPQFLKLEMSQCILRRLHQYLEWFNGGPMENNDDLLNQDTPNNKKWSIEFKKYLKEHVMELIITAILIPTAIFVLGQWANSVAIMSRLDSINEDVNENKETIEKNYREFRDSKEEYKIINEKYNQMANMLSEIRDDIDKIQSDIYKPQIKGD